MTFHKLNKTVWDNTNIGENYPGITAPLTYSFIKDAYAQVYERFLARIGVSQKQIAENRHILKNMLGYIHGQVYYQIENWYRFLTFLPGFRYNKDFFEAMLDPAEKKEKQYLPDFVVKLNGIEKIRILLSFIISLVFFPFLHAKFQQTFKVLYEKYKQIDITRLSNKELILQFENIQDRFFALWSITIINDFKVMIFFGILSKYISRFKDSERLIQDIYSVKNMPRSVIPLKQIIRIVHNIKNNPKYSQLFSKSPHIILNDLKKDSFKDLYTEIGAYLEQYGSRSANELKLEEAKFSEDPTLFIRLIKGYLKLSKEELNQIYTFSERKGDQVSHRDLSFINRKVLSLLKAITIHGIYLREFYRMKRGQAFGIARELFLEMGARMQKTGDLSDRKDIFYLYKYEILDYLQYQSLHYNFDERVRMRKKLLTQYAKEKLPRRIVTEEISGKETITHVISNKSHILRGKGTAKGKVEAEVIVVTSLDYTLDYRNKILVTTATDPGWTVIFPLLKGVITEQGGLLSHASIIARELGIPCLVQVSNATTRLQTGEKVKIDALKGTITVQS